jgi:hypothetical protein
VREEYFYHDFVLGAIFFSFFFFCEKKETKKSPEKNYSVFSGSSIDEHRCKVISAFVHAFVSVSFKIRKLKGNGIVRLFYWVAVFYFLFLSKKRNKKATRKKLLRFSGRNFDAW